MTNLKEYDKTIKLMGTKGSYFFLPESVILNKGKSAEKTVSVLSFFLMRRGLDRKVMFTVKSIVEWLGMTPDAHKGATNDKIIIALKELAKEGLVSFSDKLSHSKPCTATVNIDEIKRRVDEGYFAVVYVDEIQKIMDYRKSKKTPLSTGADKVFLVFSWLRMRIPRRSNDVPYGFEVIDENFRVKEDETREQNRLIKPEAWNCYFRDIAEELGLTERTVSDAVSILESIGLIVSKTLKREKDPLGQWHTGWTIFCNAYKREKGQLLASGDSYTTKEIAAKEEALKALQKKWTTK